jgi:hypothetical protein
MFFGFGCDRKLQTDQQKPGAAYFFRIKSRIKYQIAAKTESRVRVSVNTGIFPSGNLASSHRPPSAPAVIITAM